MKKVDFKLLGEFSDKDFYPDFEEEVLITHVRRRVRGIIFDEEKNIALVKINHLVLPGGGVEVGEELQEAIERESMEEIGCILKNIKPFASTLETRARLQGKQETYCFIAHVEGEKGKPTTTQEDEQNIKVLWFRVTEAIEKLKEEQASLKPENYNAHFNLKAHLLFLNEFKNLQLNTFN